MAYRQEHVLDTGEAANAYGLGARFPHRVRNARQQLGPLGELPGLWKGHGFSLISRPDFQRHSQLFLELIVTEEELRFNAIGGPFPNRGSLMSDVEMFGVHYLHQLIDRDASAIRIEPGIWLNMSAAGDPEGPASVVRLGAIPRGDSMRAQGSSFTVSGPPRIALASTTPFKTGDPGELVPFGEFDLASPTAFRTTPTPAGVTQAIVNDPRRSRA